MPRPLRVFLCHASQDKPAVRKLYLYLKQHGVQPWLDREHLLPGQNWEVEIPKAIDTSDVILVCLSKNSVNKEGYVQKEIAFALDKALEKPEGAIFIIPVKLEDCEVPARLKKYQWVEYFRIDGRKRLILGLNERAASAEDIFPIMLEGGRKVKRTSKMANNKKVIQDFESVSGTTLEMQGIEFVKELSKKTYRKSKIIELLTGKPHLVFRITAFLLVVLALFGIYPFLKTYLVEKENSEGTSTQTLTELLNTSNSSIVTTTKIPIAKLTSTSIPPPSLGIGSTMISEKDGMVMVYVPEGEFTMGSDAFSDGQPIHTVNLDSFWIDQTEVTNAMYTKCVEDGDCTPPSSSNSYTHDGYYGNSEFNDYPVIYVNWNQANAYCSWAGRKLPTEAEWEKAARGTDGRTYPWGEEISCNIANYYDGRKYCVDDTSKVGTYPSGASIYGALDMAGNVWEWVSTLYQDYPYNATDGREDLTASGSRVLRGGAWDINGYNVRSALRYGVGPAGTSNSFGFRCSLSHP